jgi:hypothetical protein
MIVDPEHDNMVCTYSAKDLSFAQSLHIKAKKALDDSPPSYEDANSRESITYLALTELTDEFRCGVIIKWSYTAATTTLYNAAASYPTTHGVQLHASCYETVNNDITAA